MDVPRQKKNSKRKPLILAAGLIGLSVAGIALARLPQAMPTVDRDAVLIGTVQRGEMVREIRGTGILLPERVRHVAAEVSGRVEEVRVAPGAEVESGTVLFRLSNADVELDALLARQQLTAATQRLIELRRALGLQALSQRAEIATATAAFHEARRMARADSTLAARELIPLNQAERSREARDGQVIALDARQQSLTLLEQTMDLQLAAQKEQVERLRAVHAVRQRRVESMNVRAGAAGIVQDLKLEPGQWIQSGLTLARVAEPGRLRAELRVSEVQAGEVGPGQAVFIDTRSDTIHGRVRRVDPNAEDGRVRVDVVLEDELPPSARPDLNIDGTVVIERLNDVLYVDRPTFAQGQRRIGAFKLEADTPLATRVDIELGRSSVRFVEVLAGLAEGDRLVLSDMSRWASAERIRIQ